MCCCYMCLTFPALPLCLLACHIPEHMLFLGTRKFPDESAYNKFLNVHGGRSNAFTAHEATNYYFDVKHDHLKGVLDRYVADFLRTLCVCVLIYKLITSLPLLLLFLIRFSGFFIDPLLSESCTEREMKAVDSGMCVRAFVSCIILNIHM